MSDFVLVCDFLYMFFYISVSKYSNTLNICSWQSDIWKVDGEYLGTMDGEPSGTCMENILGPWVGNIWNMDGEYLGSMDGKRSGSWMDDIFGVDNYSPNNSFSQISRIFGKFGKKL